MTMYELVTGINLFLSNRCAKNSILLSNGGFVSLSYFKKLGLSPSLAIGYALDDHTVAGLRKVYSLTPWSENNESTSAISEESGVINTWILRNSHDRSPLIREMEHSLKPSCSGLNIYVPSIKELILLFSVVSSESFRHELYEIGLYNECNYVNSEYDNFNHRYMTSFVWSSTELVKNLAKGIEYRTTGNFNQNIHFTNISRTKSHCGGVIPFYKF